MIHAGTPGAGTPATRELQLSVPEMTGAWTTTLPHCFLSEEHTYSSEEEKCPLRLWKMYLLEWVVAVMLATKNSWSSRGIPRVPCSPSWGHNRVHDHGWEMPSLEGRAAWP